MRSALIFLGSALFTGSVILNAVITKKQFYPSVVYITKSNPSMAVSIRSLTIKNFHSIMINLIKISRNVLKRQFNYSQFLCSNFFQVIYFQSLVLVLMLGKLMRKVNVLNTLITQHFKSYLFVCSNHFRFSWEL